ncbi:uroporphyrinogen-III synthase [Streptococcus rupicaprae]|uniref:Uroporphyrinogen-III synthase n=1 Tax=Streptococcus rupicaprae TaxID=759619 RepID=A0ABV2FF06_9STRE
MTKFVIITREQALATDLEQRLVAQGYTVAHLPLIACVANPIPERVLKVVPLADWVFFTSAVAAECFQTCLRPHHRIATIGFQTSKAVEALGYPITFEAKGNYARDFLEEWLALGLSRQTILLPQSSLSNPLMAEVLVEQGHEVLAFPMYETRPNVAGQSQVSAYLKQPEVIWTFASPSAWESFYQVATRLPETHEVVVIGTSTAQAVQADGVPVTAMPVFPSVEQMVQLIIDRRRV